MGWRDQLLRPVAIAVCDVAGIGWLGRTTYDIVPGWVIVGTKAALYLHELPPLLH